MGSRVEEYGRGGVAEVLDPDLRQAGVGAPAGSAAIALSDLLVLLAANRALVAPGQARRRRSTGRRR